MAFQEVANKMLSFMRSPSRAVSTPAGTSKKGGRKLTGEEKHLLQFVGSAKPGSSKKARGPHIVSGQVLSQKGRFADIPSSGGFTRLGTNMFGESVVRSNITGKVGLESGFASIDASSRALGAAKGGKELSAEDNTRRGPAEKSGQRAPRPGAGTDAAPEATKKKKKSLLGTEDTLGTQPILG